MDPDAVFNRYDIRGSYPDEIDERFAERIGKAAGTLANARYGGTVIMGRDDRENATAVLNACLMGVRSTGADVIDAGEGPTDRTACASAHYGGMGLMVTASHHAWERTGFKLLYPEGNGFSNEDLAELKELFHSRSFDAGEGALLNVQHEFDELYLERAQRVFATYADGIDGTILLDEAGAARRLAAPLFEALGADVIPVEHDGRPAPEPSAETRSRVAEQLTETGADLAVGFDPDGDRVYIIHPELGWISGDQILYLLARITDADRIVASLDTSPVIEGLDADITYTNIGDIFVAAKGRDIEADLLGEPNGHYAVTEFSWYNSGLFCGALLAANHDELAEMLADIQGYSTHRAVRAFDTDEQRDAAMTDAIKQIARNYDVISTDDGYKFTGDGFTALLRPSGTSPKLRLIVHTAENRTEMYERLQEELL